jgi:hypothetical protein
MADSDQTMAVPSGPTLLVPHLQGPVIIAYKAIMDDDMSPVGPEATNELDLQFILTINHSNWLFCLDAGLAVDKVCRFGAGDGPAGLDRLSRSHVALAETFFQAKRGHLGVGHVVRTDGQVVHKQCFSILSRPSTAYASRSGACRGCDGLHRALVKALLHARADWYLVQVLPCRGPQPGLGVA